MKKIEKLLPILRTIQPILIGVLIALVIVMAIEANQVGLMLMALLTGFFVGDYIASKRIRKLMYLLDELNEAYQKTIESITDIMQKLSDDGIKVDMVTNDPDLERLEQILKEEDDKIIN